MNGWSIEFSPFLKQCFVTAAVCSDVIGHGCIIGYPAVLLPQLKENTSISMTETDASWIVSVLGIAMLIGIFLTPPAMGIMGRKPAHYIVILALLAAWLIFAMASNVTELLIGRTLQGLSFGMFTPLRSVLIGEYTSPRNRGAFLTTIALAQGFGIMLVHLIGSLLSWQVTALVCLFFTFTSLIMTIFSPESPSWLADKGRNDECRKVFRWLRGMEEEKELEEMINASIDSNKSSYKQKRVKQLSESIVKKEFYKPCLIMLHVYCMLSFSGSMTIAAYSTTIISILTGPETNPDTWMVALDVQRIISNTAAVFVINKVKRRTMTFATLSLCIVCHLAIAGYVYAKHNGYLIYDALWIPAILLNCHYFSIATGMVPLPSVIAGEIFPAAFRSIGGSLSIVFYSTFMFLALKTFSGLVSSIGLHGTYVIYVVILFYNLLALWWLLPETKGKTLQEIESGFRRGPSKEHEIAPLKVDSDTGKG